MSITCISNPAVLFNTAVLLLIIQQHYVMLNNEAFFFVNFNKKERLYYQTVLNLIQAGDLS